MRGRVAGIIGERVTLRAVEGEDLDIIYIWENDPTLWGCSNTRIPYSRGQLRSFIEGQSQTINCDGGLRLMICKTDILEFRGEHISQPGEVIGMVDIFEYDPHNHRAGVGIVIDPAHRGVGYGADALLTVERYLSSMFELHQLWCNISAQNTHSISLFERCGYSLSGVKRDWVRCEGGYADELLYQKII